jgi:hypothetical protein
MVERQELMGLAPALGVRPASRTTTADTSPPPVHPRSCLAHQHAVQQKIRRFMAESVHNLFPVVWHQVKVHCLALIDIPVVASSATQHALRTANNKNLIDHGNEACSQRSSAFQANDSLPFHLIVRRR